MDFKFSLEELMSVFNHLGIPYTFEEVNSDIFHVKVWHGMKIWILRFKKNYDCFEFTNWIEVK